MTKYADISRAFQVRIKSTYHCWPQPLFRHCCHSKSQGDQEPALPLYIEAIEQDECDVYDLSVRVCKEWSRLNYHICRSSLIPLTARPRHEAWRGSHWPLKGLRVRLPTQRSFFPLAQVAMTFVLFCLFDRTFASGPLYGSTFLPGIWVFDFFNHLFDSSSSASFLIVAFFFIKLSIDNISKQNFHPRKLFPVIQTIFLWLSQ